MEAKIRGIVRIINTDIDGNKSVYNGLRKIKGIGFMFSNAICSQLNIEKNKKIGTLSQDEVKKIEILVKNPSGLPNWLLNRRKDYDTGENLHLTMADLKLRKEFDIKRLKQIKSYRGMRHAWNLPVRGQRTRGHFRKGGVVGVQKKGIKQQQKAAKKQTPEKGKGRKK